MKSFLGFLFFLCIALPMAAEKKPQHAVYTEFGGISNTFSVSYDIALVLATVVNLLLSRFSTTTPTCAMGLQFP